MIPGLGRSPGGGHGNPLQYSRLENPTDTGARQATVHGVLRSQTQLNDFHFISEMHAVLFDIVFVFFSLIRKTIAITFASQTVF